MEQIDLPSKLMKWKKGLVLVWSSYSCSAWRQNRKGACWILEDYSLYSQFQAGKGEMMRKKKL